MTAARGRSASPRSEQGATLATFGLTAAVVLGMMALAIDLGYGFTQRRLAQNTADAIALAQATMLGKVANDWTGDHDVWVTGHEVARRNTKNGAEASNFTFNSWYIDNTLEPMTGEQVGIPCTAPPAGTIGIKTITSRSWPTWFARFLSPSPVSDTARSEVQLITLSPDTSGGYFKLVIDGQEQGVQWSPNIPFGASQAEAQAAVDTVFNDAYGWPAGTVRVTRLSNFAYRLEWSQAGTNQRLIDVENHLDNGTVTITTQTQGAGAFELYLETSATAVLKFVSAVPVDHPDFVPYVLFSGTTSQNNGSCKIAEGKTPTFYNASAGSYVSNFVRKNCSNKVVSEPAWATGASTDNFRGFMSLEGVTTVQAGQSYTVDSSGADNASARAKLAAHWHSDYNQRKPVLLPVVTQAQATAGGARLTVSGFAFVRLTTNPSSCGGNCTLKGTVLRWVVPGVEAADTASTAVAVPARTAVLVR